MEAQCATLAHHGQFLQARGRAEWPDGTVTACFGFRHALYQDVLYQRIPAGRQTRWHARIGARLAQGFGAQAGDLAAVLAMHFLRGRLLPQAVQYLRQAGEKAMARSAHREAVGYFEQALSALSQLPETRDTREQAIDLRLALRSALRPLGDFARHPGGAARGRGPRGGPRRSASAGTGHALSVPPLPHAGRGMTRRSPPPSASSRSPQRAGEAVLQALANQYLGHRLPRPGRLSAGDRLFYTDRRVPRRGAAPRALRADLPASRELPGLDRGAMRNSGMFAEGRDLGDEGLADCRGGCAP